MNDWTNWRGPAYNGSADAKALPVKFSDTDGVKWAASLPGPSAATPIVTASTVYTTAADFKNQTLLAIALGRATGKERWRATVGTGYKSGGEGSAVQLDGRSHYASPSPVANEKRVVFFFGNGDLAAFSHDGKKLWQRNLQKEYGDFAFQWTFSSSPLLLNDTLYLQILQRDQPVGARGRGKPESFLLALAAADGRELWRANRPSQAIMESREAYATPIPHIDKGKTVLLIAGGDALTAHDPKDGRELWRWETYNEAHREAWWRLVPSPVVGDGVALVCGPKRAPVYAAKLTGDGLAWKSEERGPVTSDVPTPLFYKGRFYVLSDVRKSLSCVEAKTGRVLWSNPISPRQMCWGSPSGADGKIYCVNLNGTVFVVDAESGKTLAENVVDTEGADIRSSIAIAGSQLFVRTREKLLCVGA